MKHLFLSRREFIRLGYLGSVIGLASCTFDAKESIISIPKGILPKELLQNLPRYCQLNLIETSAAINSSKFKKDNKDFDFLGIGDGWLKEISLEEFQEIKSDELTSRLNRQAILFMSSFGTEQYMKILPIGFSPWVMLFRSGKEWLPRAKESWNVLLDPRLRGQIVLPESPRVVMSIADRMAIEDPLTRLRNHVKTYDDKNAINWVLSGEARVAVLPLQYCFPYLSKDPRLSIAFPREGAPLNWTVILKSKSTDKSFPHDWIKQTWEPPLVSKLLFRGWIPPLPFSELKKGGQTLPNDYKNILFSSPESLQNSWSMPPLTKLQEKRLLERWFN